MGTKEVCCKLFSTASECLLDISRASLYSASIAQPDSTAEDRKAHSLALADAYRLAAISSELGSGNRTVDDLDDYDLEVAARNGLAESFLRNPEGIDLSPQSVWRLARSGL